MMDIQALKIDLAQKILHTQDPTLLSMISNLFQKEGNKDWWDQLPEEIQESILRVSRILKKGKNLHMIR